jgi:hypothetical protein
VICPHPGLVINNPILSLDTKGRLNGMHTITIDLNQSTAENQKRKKTKRILIAEPNSDIQYLYSLFTKRYVGQMTKSIHETISDSILIVFSKINLLNLVNIFRQLVIYFYYFFICYC